MVTLTINSERLFVKLIFWNNLKRFTLYKKISYNMDVLWPTACMVLNPIMADNFISLFSSMMVGRSLA